MIGPEAIFDNIKAHRLRFEKEIYSEKVKDFESDEESDIENRIYHSFMTTNSVTLKDQIYNLHGFKLEHFDHLFSLYEDSFKQTSRGRSRKISPKDYLFC